MKWGYLEYLFATKFWYRGPQTFGPVVGWHGGKQMVFHVQEHVERQPILPLALQSPGKNMITLTIVVDRPDSEESRQALPDCHAANVKTQLVDVEDQAGRGQ